MDNRNHDILDEAIAALRTTGGDESLSSAVRSKLFSDIQSLQASPAGRVTGFAKGWRLALLGAIPVVVLTAIIVTGGHHAGQSEGSGQLTATKVDGQVVFTLANGKKTHIVSASTDPQRFDPAAGVKMTKNRYQVDATGGPNLVFYRID